MDTLIAPNPAPGFDKGKKPRVLGSEFGDGYMETVPDGVNTMMLQLDLSWRVLSFDAGDAMDTFFTAQEGRKFFWTMPREVTPRVWKCQEWHLVYEATTSEVSAKFMEQPY